MPISRQSVAFILLLGALAALPPLAIDMGLPALPDLEQSLGASSTLAGMTLSVFLFGFAAGPLVLGPLSDQWGRRPILLGGLVLFTLAGALCMLAPSIAWLLAARLLQGVGAGAGAVLPIAIVRDLFQGVEARMRLSYVTLVLSLAPVIAPIIGAGLVPLGGWRGIYVFLAVGGAVLLAVTVWGFEESAPAAMRRKASVKQVLANYAFAWRQPVCRRFFLVNGASFACMFAFISGSPLVFISVFGVSAGTFSLIFACVASGTIAGSFLNTRLTARHVPSARLLGMGLTLGVLATTVVATLAFTGLATVATLVPFLVLSNLSYGLIGPNASHEALHPLPHMAGVAAALLRAIQMLLGSAASALVAWGFDGRSARAMGGVMLLFAVLSAVAFVWGGRKRS